MKKLPFFVLHLFYWFYKFFYYPLFGSYISTGSIKGVDYFFNNLMVSHYLLDPFIFYMNYFFILPRFYKKGNKLYFWMMWLGLLFAYIFLRYLIQEVLFLKWYGATNYNPETSIGYYIFDNIYFGGVIIVMSFLLWIIYENVKTQNEKYRLLKEKKEAQLSFLKNQINPHFIFNTLNNIYALVAGNKNNDALKSIEKLSELMRYMYKDSEAESVALKNEIDYINSFITLQSIRILNKDCIQFKIEGEITNQKIAPLLLIPFVENVFKHGIINKPEMPIVISIFINKNILTLNLHNVINKNSKDAASGIGLANVKKRLELMYANKHTLLIENDKTNYKTTLTINLA